MRENPCQKKPILQPCAVAEASYWTQTGKCKGRQQPILMFAWPFAVHVVSKIVARQKSVCFCQHHICYGLQQIIAPFFASKVLGGLT